MRRLPALAVAFAAAAVSLTACGTDDDPATAISSPVASATSATSSSAPTSTTTETVPTENETGDAAVAPEVGEAETTERSPLGSDACAFATQDSLMAALRSSPDFNRVASPTGFRRIQCSTPFALASTSGTPQSSGVLFERTGDSWTVLDVGSAIECAQYGVTVAQAPALEGCVV